ncbi:MAG: protein kinase domain-containing protein [Hyphomicrobiales bacterium]
MPLAPGTALGPYKITGTLGAGGMGEVYRARDERLGRDVAVKVLPAAFASDADRLRRFENEARAAAKLNHPNILQIYDIGRHEGHPYLVTELLEGETLRERLLSGPLSARRAIEFGTDVAQGLAAAHDEGIVHRDLKPENLFLTRDGRVKILDFGLAKLSQAEGAGDETVANAATVGGDTDPGMVMGTVGYMSPEQVRGQAADARSDIFAFGAVLFETIAGARPFRGGTNADVMSAILTKDPPDLTTIAEEVPPVLDRIIRRCLEKLPARRFRSAQDLAFSLEAISTATSRSGSGAAAAVEGGADGGEVSFEMVTYVPRYLRLARFAPDGQSVVYSARYDLGPLRLLMKRPETPEPIPIPIADADILAISPSGEMALQMHPSLHHSGVGIGTLALAPMFGGAPRPLAENITHVDFDPSGRQLVVIHERGGRSAIEYPIGNVLYETSGHVSYVRFSPRGDRIAFFEHAMRGDDHGAVATIDLQGTKKVLTPEWATVQCLAWTPSGEEIWFNAGRRGAFRMDIFGVTPAGELRQVYSFPGSVRLHDIAKDGKILFARESYLRGILFAGPDDTQERELSWLDHSTVAAISRDGKTMLFTEQSHGVGKDYAVCVRGTDGSPVVRLGDGYGLALSPDGRWALSRGARPGAPLDLIPTGPGRKRSFPALGELIFRNRAWFTPDGDTVVYMTLDAAGTPTLAVLDVERGGTSGISLPAEFADARPSMALSPEGAEALVVLAATGESRFVPLDGSPGRRGPRFEPRDMLIDFVDGGGAVFVQTGPKTIPLSIHKVDLKSGSRAPWRDLMPASQGGLTGLYRPEFALDGAAYAYVHSRNSADLFIGRGVR